MESFNGGTLIEICTCFIEENPFEKGFSVSINIFFSGEHYHWHTQKGKIKDFVFCLSSPLHL